MKKYIIDLLKVRMIAYPFISTMPLAASWQLPPVSNIRGKYMSKTNKYRLLAGACLALAASQGAATQVCYEAPMPFTGTGTGPTTYETICNDVITSIMMTSEEAPMLSMEDTRTRGYSEQQAPDLNIFHFHYLPEYQ